MLSLFILSISQNINKEFSFTKWKGKQTVTSEVIIKNETLWVTCFFSIKSDAKKILKLNKYYYATRTYRKSLTSARNHKCCYCYSCWNFQKETAKCCLNNSTLCFFHNHQTNSSCEIASVPYSSWCPGQRSPKKSRRSCVIWRSVRVED